MTNSLFTFSIVIKQEDGGISQLQLFFFTMKFVRLLRNLMMTTLQRRPNFAEYIALFLSC